MTSPAPIDGDPGALTRVERLDQHTFSARCLDGASGRIFGGQSLAQAMQAASMALDHRRPPNSLHIYFVAPGRPDEEVVYTTEVVKRGQAIDIVLVTAHQGTRTILSGHASFHEPEGSTDFQPAMPDAPLPHTLPESDYVPDGTNRLVRRPFDVRYVDERFRDESGPQAPLQDVWIRTRRPVASDLAIDHAALLVFAVDFLVSHTSHMPLRGDNAPGVGASLDHGMWFHRTFRADEWLLVSNLGISYAGARALSQCTVFDMNGTLVATATQEALIRPHPSTTTRPEESR